MRRINSGYPPVTGCWLWSHNEQNKLNWELIPPKQAETSQKTILGNSICLNFCYNGKEFWGWGWGWNFDPQLFAMLEEGAAQAGVVPDMWEGPLRTELVHSRKVPKFRVVETVVLENGRFVPCRKQAALTKIGGNSDIAFYPQKQGILLLKPRKSTKMTKMAGVTPTKWPFAKSTVLTTLINQSEKSSVVTIIRSFQMGRSVVFLVLCVLAKGDTAFKS